MELPHNQMMEFNYKLWQAALANERGVSHLESRLFLDALTEFVEAHRLTLSIRQVLDESGLVPLSLQSACRRVPTYSRQMLFPANDRSEDDETEPMDMDADPSDLHYVYQRGLSFATSDTRPGTDGAPTTTDPHMILHSCNLLLATCAYNIGMCFHLRSKVLNESMKELCHRVALELYNAAIETISIDQLIVAQGSITDDDSSCLLVVLLNNKAVLCYEGGDHESCQLTRTLLVLWLNAFGGNVKSERAFLDAEDITNMYRNGFLLVPPSVAGAA